MKYKALIFDLDGTAIPNKIEGRPSARLIKFVQKAKKHILVSAATGRPIATCRKIFNLLKLTSPCIISGGSQIIKPQTEKIIWQRPLSKSQAKKIIKTCLPYPNEIILDSGIPHGQTAKDITITSPKWIIVVFGVKKDGSQPLAEQLKKIPNIVIHGVNSWAKGRIDLHITHKLATKNMLFKFGLKC